MRVYEGKDEWVPNNVMVVLPMLLLSCVVLLFMVIKRGWLVCLLTFIIDTFITVNISAGTMHNTYTSNTGNHDNNTNINT